MKFLDKIKNRYNILMAILVVFMSILTFRLAVLTIAEGDYYRAESDNKRIKEVHITPPRGEIRDRHGRLLAGNKPSFTVQLLKDEFNMQNRETKNKGVLKLVRFLEEDGVNYLDNFPIELNVYGYKSEDDYFQEYLNPMDKVIEIILKNNLLPQVLNSYFLNYEYENHFQFITINRTINALKNKNIDIPFIVEIKDNELVIEFDENKNIASWKETYGIKEEDSPIESLIKIIDEDKTIIRKTIDHSISRKLVYNMLLELDLVENIILEEYSISFMEDYLIQKRILIKNYPIVTMETTAKEDFVNIFIETSLKEFLERKINTKKQDVEEIILPGKVLLEMLNESGIEVPLEIKYSEESNIVIYKYTGKEEIGDKNLTELLIDYGKEAKILSKFITSEKIKALAQEQLLSNGINPRISIAGDFEYVAINNLNNFLERYKIEDNESIKDIFEKLRDTYELDKNISKYETRSIFAIYNQLNKQGYLAYQPINLAYGIKDSTVARIEENAVDLPGINISIEPVRYYPEGETAAHILGNLGKISSAGEISRYIEGNGYSPSDIIGKTGIEESFEDSLRGKGGVRTVEVDVVGNTTKVLKEERFLPGDNIYLTIDLKLQKVAEEALAKTLREISRGGTYDSPWGDYEFGIHRRKNRPYINATSGAVVAIDVKTGQVLAMASNPSYDPNLFSTGISNTDWLSLFPENEKDPLAPRPLYNVATQTAVQPGSIYKMVPALAALENGLSPDKKIRDMGYVDIGTDRFRCLIWTQSGSTHGFENVYEALRDSCNYYFYSLALGKNQRTNESLGMKISIEDIMNISEQLGLNEKTGIEINIPGEVVSGVPTPQRKIINTKASLRNLLRRDISKYFKEEIEIDDDLVKETIDEIVSWTELEEVLTRGEVIRRLDDLGIHPEKRMPGEREGLADIIKFSYLNQAGWNITDTLNVVIGQGLNAYTPIQMANYVATISNGGYKHKLTLVENIKNYNNSQVIHKHEVNPERIELKDHENLEHIKKGMKLVSEEGTARRIFQNFPVDVGSKTGTAEKKGINPSTGETYDDFAWFLGFAPYEDPEIAIAAVIFQGGSGGYAAPLIRDIIAEYLGLNETGIKDSLPYENILSK